MQRTTWWLPTGTLIFCALAPLAGLASAAEESRDSGSRDSVNRDSVNRDSESQNEKIQHHASLGVSLSQSDGNVKVIAVAPGSPAAQAGVHVGDEIRYVNDTRIRTTHGLVDEIGEFQPGEHVSLMLHRNGQEQTVHARLAARNAVFNERQANRGRMAYSYGPNEEEQGSHAQQVQRLQQQVNGLQQQVNLLRASSMQGRRAGWWNTQPYSWESRTDVNRSSPRGWSRDHGPRETSYGTVAPEN